MFDNIGGKIKILAKVIAVLGIVFSIIIGIYYMTMGKEYLVYGLTVAIVGSLVSWISSFFAYGFGELISNTDEMKRNLESSDSYNKEITKILNNEVVDKKKEKENKTVLSDEKIDLKCPSCGINLSYSKSLLEEKTEIACPFCKNDIKVKK
ncbi:MAG: hypothetical protein IKJ33_03910 [Clostridia bacterium]|nr:hypothetical protein [Clostridia bacterium]